MTKNEYIASIMLEAADLLKEDDEQESLNEGVGSTILETIKKIGRAIKKVWKWFIGLFTRNKQNKAKKDSEVVDPNKAIDLVNKVVKAYDNNEEIPKINIEDIKKPIKEGQNLDNYNNLETKIEDAIRRICINSENETDEERLKKAKEVIAILDKITMETTKAAYIIIEGCDAGQIAHYYNDKDQIIKDHYRYKDGLDITDYYKNGKRYKSKGKEGSFMSVDYYDSDGETTRKSISTNGEKKYKYKNGNISEIYNKSKTLKEAIDLLYDKAVIADTLDEATMYIDKAEQLEALLED